MGPYTRARAGCKRATAAPQKGAGPGLRRAVRTGVGPLFGICGTGTGIAVAPRSPYRPPAPRRVRMRQ